MALRTVQKQKGSFLVAIPPIYMEDLGVGPGDLVCIRSEAPGKISIEKLTKGAMVSSFALMVLGFLEFAYLLTY